MIAPNAGNLSKWAQEPPPPSMQRLSIPVLKTIWNAMNLPGKPPPVYEDPGINPRFAGYQPYNTRAVYMDPKYIQRLRTMGFPGNRDMSGAQVLAHEYAHVAQPMALRKPVEEGGAEAYAWSRMPAIQRALNISYKPGLRPPGGGDLWYRMTYPEWTRSMMRGSPYNVERGQFGR